MINWKVRLYSKQFWIGLVGVIASAVVGIAGLLGVQLDLGQYTDAATALITGVFAVLGVVGVVNDPTTKGLSDSNQALTYDAPKDDEAEMVAIADSVEDMRASEDTDDSEVQ